MENIEDYKSRHIRWQDYALTQLGYTNNIIITIAIAFFAYSIDKTYLSKFSFHGEFDLKMFFYVFSILFILLSIIFGALTSLSRLYDFKITRNIALTRQRFCNHCKDNHKSLPGYDFPRPCFCSLFCSLTRILFCHIELMTTNDIKTLLETSALTEKYNRLRKLSHILGILTWKLIKLQFLCLILSFVFYFLSFLFQV